MGRRSRARWARLRRAARGLWPDHNPLRRTCDRAEAGIVAGSLAVLVIGAPLAGLFAGQRAYTASISAQRVQQATWHQVSATVLADAISSWYGTTALAQWRAPGGKKRAGEISAPAGAKAGTSVRVWVDASGRVATSPMRDADVAGNVALASVLTGSAVGMLALGCAAIAHLALNRRRLAAWDADWRLTEPQWTRRRQS